MRTYRSFGLAAVLAALLAIAGASTASATELYTSLGTAKFGTDIDFSLKSGTSVNIATTSGESVDQCTTSTISSDIQDPGSSSTTASGPIHGWTWGSCTFPTSTVYLMLSKLEVHHISGTTNGTVTNGGSDIGVTINTIFFGSCIYALRTWTDLGTITGGNPATLHLNAVMNVDIGSAFACPATAKLTGTYVSTELGGTLRVEAS